VGSTDPLFYMHHTNLDRAWWSWQTGSLEERLTDISGPSLPLSKDIVTLDFMMKIGNLANVTVREMMDIRAWPTCVEYDEVYEISGEGGSDDDREDDDA